MRARFSKIACALAAAALTLAGCVGTLPAYQAPPGPTNVRLSGVAEGGALSSVSGRFLVYRPKDACTHTLAGTLPFKENGVTTVIAPGQTVYLSVEFTRRTLNSTSMIDTARYLPVRPGMFYDVRAEYRGSGYELSIRETPMGGSGAGREVGILPGELPGC